MFDNLFDTSMYEIKYLTTYRKESWRRYILVSKKVSHRSEA
jgi:hypothetical protein